MSDLQTQPGELPAVLQESPIKSKPRTSREFERALREMGFSKSESRSIASYGFKAAEQAPESSEDVSELAALVERNLQVLSHIKERIEDD